MTNPSGLDERGAAFFNSISDRYELTRSEVELLLECARTMDTVERLERAVRASDDVKLLAEIRQQRVTLGRLLAQLAIPTEQVESLATQRARHAAAKRWEGHVRRSES